MRRRALALVAAVPLCALAGCGIGATGPQKAGAAATGAVSPGTTSYEAKVAFIGPYGMQLVTRREDSPVGPQQALRLLFDGPTRAERERGLTSVVPGALRDQVAAVPRSGAVDLYLPLNVRQLDHTALSQVACTAANAEVPGDKPATDVVVHVHERNAAGASWDLRCDVTGNADPVGAPKPAPGRAR